MYIAFYFFEEIWFFHEGHTLDCNIIKLVFTLQQHKSWPDWIDIQHWRQPSVLYVSFVWFPFLSFSRFFLFSQLSTTSLAASLHSLLISLLGCSSDQPFLSPSFCFSFSHYLFIEATSGSSSSNREYISFFSAYTQLTPQPNQRILDLQCLCHYDNLFPLIDWFCVVSALVSRFWATLEVFYPAQNCPPKLGHIFSKSDNLLAAAMAAIFASVVAVQQQHPILLLLLLLLFRYTCYSWAFAVEHSFSLFPNWALLAFA